MPQWQKQNESLRVDSLTIIQINISQVFKDYFHGSTVVLLGDCSQVPDGGKNLWSQHSYYGGRDRQVSVSSRPTCGGGGRQRWRKDRVRYGTLWDALGYLWWTTKIWGTLFIPPFFFLASSENICFVTHSYVAFSQAWRVVKQILSKCELKLVIIDIILTWKKMNNPAHETAK